MGQLEGLGLLSVHHNLLSGTIPGSLGYLPQLRRLYLHHNQFSGNIPPGLGKCKNMELLDLSHNRLKGSIPGEVAGLQNLQFYLNLSWNSLQGSLPLEISKITMAQVIDVSGNKLTGTIPEALGSCIAPNKNWDIEGFHMRRLLLLLVVLARPTCSELVGSVYKGIMRDGTIVAIKVLNLQGEEAHKSLITECKALGRVRHRNLIRIRTVYSNPNFKALVLQFMSNGSLEKHLYPNIVGGVCGLSLIERLNIAIDIAHGMSYLHHYCFVQVVHCDLKPSNVLLDDKMTAHVTDFGIAQLICANSKDSLTSTLPLRGSVGYIAPEYGFNETVSTKGDVYSYGIVLLEILTRKRPTDNIFVDGLTLQKWVSMAFPNRILEVVDGSLLTYPSDEGMDRNDMLNCLFQLIHLALWCTNESPERRPNMREIVEVLEGIKRTLAGTTRVSLLQSDMSQFLSSQIVADNNTRPFESQSYSTS